MHSFVPVIAQAAEEHPTSYMIGQILGYAFVVAVVAFAVYKWVKKSKGSSKK